MSSHVALGQQIKASSRGGVGGTTGEGPSEVLDRHPDDGENGDGQYQGYLGPLPGEQHTGGHDHTDDGHYDRGAVMEEEGFRHPVDVGEPPRLSTFQPAHQVVRRLRRTSGSETEGRANRAEFPTQMAQAAVIPTVRVSTNASRWVPGPQIPSSTART